MEALLGLPLDDVTRKLKGQAPRQPDGGVFSGQSRQAMPRMEKMETEPVPHQWADDLLHGTDWTLDSITKAIKQAAPRRRGGFMRQGFMTRSRRPPRFFFVRNGRKGRRLQMRQLYRGRPFRRNGFVTKAFMKTRRRKRYFGQFFNGHPGFVDQPQQRQREQERALRQQSMLRIREDMRLRQQKEEQERLKRLREQLQRHRFSVRSVSRVRSPFKQRPVTLEEPRNSIPASRPVLDYRDVDTRGPQGRETGRRSRSISPPPRQMDKSPRRLASMSPPRKSSGRRSFPTVKVTGIPPKYTSNDIMGAFNMHFDVHHVVKKSPGCAYVLFNTLMDARRAKKQFDGGEMNDCKIKVTWMENMEME